MSTQQNYRKWAEYIQACGLEVLESRRPPGSHITFKVGTGDRTAQIVLSLGKLSPRNQRNAQALIRRISRELTNKKLSDR